jgi:hypothetical protein
LAGRPGPAAMAALDGLLACGRRRQGVSVAAHGRPRGAGDGLHLPGRCRHPAGDRGGPPGRAGDPDPVQRLLVHPLPAGRSNPSHSGGVSQHRNPPAAVSGHVQWHQRGDRRHGRGGGRLKHGRAHAGGRATAGAPAPAHLDGDVGRLGGTPGRWIPGLSGLAGGIATVAHPPRQRRGARPDACSHPGSGIGPARLGAPARRPAARLCPVEPAGNGRRHAARRLAARQHPGPDAPVCRLFPVAGSRGRVCAAGVLGPALGGPRHAGPATRQAAAGHCDEGHRRRDALAAAHAGHRIDTAPDAGTSAHLPPGHCRPARTGRRAGGRRRPIHAGGKPRRARRAMPKRWRPCGAGGSTAPG